jgi:hypothetical protein
MLKQMARKGSKWEERECSECNSDAAHLSIITLTSQSETTASGRLCREGLLPRSDGGHGNRHLDRERGCLVSSRPATGHLSSSLGGKER